MNIVTKAVLDVGLPARERVVLSVLRDVDLGDYLLSRGTILKAGELSMDIQPLFWFHNVPVKAGDLVVVYTKAGASKSKKNDDGSTSWFYYLGRQGSMWTQQKSAVVLAEISEWDHHAIPSADDSTREPE